MADTSIFSGPPYTQMQDRLLPPLLQALDAMDYKRMTRVQAEVLSQPNLAADFLVQAKTGTGKTTAFLLPALQSLLATRNSRPLSARHVAILVIAPTRELAQQIVDECNRLTAFCDPEIECHLAVGGTKKFSALEKFITGHPTVLVATPGRLKDYLITGNDGVDFSLSQIRGRFSSLRTMVLDEADAMLDHGFIDDIVDILARLPSKARAGWQGMCFSATIPPKIDQVLHHILGPSAVRLSTISAADVPTVDTVPQTLVAVDDITTLKAIVFTHTARNAGLLHQLFSFDGVSPGNLAVHQMHSRMSQPARNGTIELFRTAKSGILFASDVVGRGIDFPDIELVVQIGLPMNSDQYVHRVGRTGRVDRSGRAVIILMPEEMVFVRQNPQFPIQQIRLTDSRVSTAGSAAIMASAADRLPDLSKEQAYAALLGYLKTKARMMGLSGPQMVSLANRFSGTLGCEEPPALEASTIGKMGFKGVRGLRVKPGKTVRAPSQRQRQDQGQRQGQVHPQTEQAPSRGQHGDSSTNQPQPAKRGGREKKNRPTAPLAQEAAVAVIEQELSTRQLSGEGEGSARKTKRRRRRNKNGTQTPAEGANAERNDAS